MRRNFGALDAGENGVANSASDDEVAVVAIDVFEGDPRDFTGIGGGK